MKHFTYQWNSFDGLKLFGQAWVPENSPWAVISLVHGMGEHSSRYQAWAEKFVGENVAIVTFDQRGHGLSQGKRGTTPSYQALLNDIDTLLKKTRELFPEVPVILYGHSMGGGEVITHALRKKTPYKGVISTSPWLITQAAPGKLVISFVRLLTQIIPEVALPCKFDAGLLSRDAEIVKQYKQDKLVHPWVSFRLFLEGYDAGYWALDHAEQLKTPLLLMHGEDDSITSPMASRDFAQQSNKHCHFKTWEKAFHELHHELIKKEVFKYTISWIRELIQN